MNFVEIFKRETNNDDISSQLELLKKKVTEQTHLKVSNFFSGVFAGMQEIVLSKRKNWISDYHIETLKVYTISKNELLSLSKHSIYSFCLDDYDESYLNKFCAGYLLQSDTVTFQDYLEDYKTNFEKILYNDIIIHRPEWEEQSRAFSLGPDPNVIRHPFFEHKYIYHLRNKIQELIDDKNDFNEFLSDNIFNWNILSIAYFYHFLQEEKLLLPSTSFVNFKDFLQINNRDLLNFSLYESKFTKPNLNFILNCLKSYFFKDRGSYTSWVQHKVRYVSKQNKKRFGDDFEIQTSNTFNRLDKKNNTEVKKKVVFIFNTIDLLEKSTTYLN